MKGKGKKCLLLKSLRVLSSRLRRSCEIGVNPCLKGITERVLLLHGAGEIVTILQRMIIPLTKGVPMRSILGMAMALVTVITAGHGAELSQHFGGAAD